MEVFIILIICNSCYTVRIVKWIGREYNAFDKVVAGNVIHLLDNPYGALQELERVCKKGGKIIIPTYVLAENEVGESLAVRLMDKAGADFKRQFSYQTYREFFRKADYADIEYRLIEGKMPCAIAVITKEC